MELSYILTYNNVHSYVKKRVPAMADNREEEELYNEHFYRRVF